MCSLKEERITVQHASYENQQKLIQDTEQFINRFRYKATKAVQVQSRIKQLEKLDRIEVEKEDDLVMNLKFPPAPSDPAPLWWRLLDLKKQFGEHQGAGWCGYGDRTGRKSGLCGQERRREDHPVANSGGRTGLYRGY